MFLVLVSVSREINVPLMMFETAQIVYLASTISYNSVTLGLTVVCVPWAPYLPGHFTHSA